MTPNRVVYDFLMHITLPVSFVYLYNRERAKQTVQIPASDPPNPIFSMKKKKSASFNRETLDLPISF